jgi:hypothetical protein
VQITDEMCRRALNGWDGDRIQGFSTPHDSPNGLNRTWGAPHYIRDVKLAPDKQEIWRGDSQDEMLDRCEVERMRLALQAALIPTKAKA